MHLHIPVHVNADVHIGKRGIVATRTYLGHSETQTGSSRSTERSLACTESVPSFVLSRTPEGTAVGRTPDTVTLLAGNFFVRFRVQEQSLPELRIRTA